MLLRILAFGGRVAAGFAFASLALACAPNTPYRNAAMVPAVRPMTWDGRTAEAGTIRVEGTGSFGDVSRDPFPTVHQSALHVPNTMVDGVAMIAPVDGVELGFHGSYAHYAWTEASAQGTPPIPSRPAIYGLGPQARFSFPVDKGRHVFFGFGLGAQLYSLPYARWTRNNPGGNSSASGGFNCGAGGCSGSALGEAWSPSTYRLTEESSEVFVTTQGAIAIAGTVDPKYGHAFATFGVHTAFKNDGFATEPKADPISTNGWTGVAALGYGIALYPVRFSGMVYKPLTTSASEVNYTVGGMLSAGVEIDVARKAPAKPVKAPEVEPEPTPTPPVPAAAPSSPPPLPPPPPAEPPPTEQSL